MKETMSIIKTHIHKAANSMQAALSYFELGNSMEAMRQIETAIDELRLAQVRIASSIAGRSK